MRGWCVACGVPVVDLDSWAEHQHRDVRPFCRFHSYTCRCPYLARGPQTDRYRSQHPAA